MASLKLPSSRLDRAFIIAIYLKALDGVAELAGGVVLLFVRPGQAQNLSHLISQFAQDHDPDNFILRGLATFTGNLSTGTIRFAAWYLIFDALVKLVLIYEILHKRYWAYVALIIILSLLVVYQTYRIMLTHSVALTALTLFDILVIVLSAKEYLRHRSESSGGSVV